MENKQDTAQVLIKPPVLYLGAILLGLLLHFLLPLPSSLGMVGTLTGFTLIGTGILIAFWGSREFHRQHTNVNPDFPATTVVTSGPYQYTRNPMYLGLTAVQLGSGLALGAWWVMLLIIPTIFILIKGVIEREEAYLAAKFGQTYLDYKNSVRRWL